MKARDAYRRDKAAAYVCGLCRGAGHNRRTCPSNTDKAPPRVTDSRSQRAARMAVAKGIPYGAAARAFGVTRQAVSQAAARFRT